MKNLVKRFKSLLYNKNFVSYFAVDLFATILFLIVRLIPDANGFFLLFEISNETINVIITIVVTIITLIASLESLIVQLYFGRRTKKYFSRTVRNIFSIVLFSCIGIAFAFHIDRWSTELLFVLAVFYSFVFLLFVVVDIINLDISIIIRKKIKNISESLKNGDDKLIKKSEFELRNFLKDSLLNDDSYYIEQIIRLSPDIVDEFLNFKYKNDCQKKNNSPCRQAIEFVLGLYFSCVEFCKKDSFDFVYKSILAAYSEITIKLLKYNDNSLIIRTEKRLLSFLLKTDNPNRFFNFYCVLLLLEETGGQDFIFKKIYILNDMLSLADSYVSLIGEDLISLISSFIQDGKIKDITDEQYNVLNTIIIRYVNSNKNDISLSALFLYNLFVLSLDKFDDKFINLISYNIPAPKQIKFTDNNFKIIEWTIHLIVDNYGKKINPINYYKIHLENSRIAIEFIDKKIKIDFLKYEKSIFESCYKEYIGLFMALASNSSDIMNRIAFDWLNSFVINKFEKNNLNELKKIVDLYICSLECSASENFDAIKESFFDLIAELDKTNRISDGASDYIIFNYIGLCETLISERSQNAKSSANDLYKFAGFDCDFNFINQNKQKVYPRICEETMKLAILSAEYQNNDVIKECSGVIGWSLYRVLYDRIDCYKEIFKKSVQPMFHTLIKLDYQKEVVVFVGTLHVVVFTYCLSQKEISPYFGFARNVIKKLSKNEIDILYQSILLREHSNGWRELSKEKFEIGINYFKDLLEDRKKELD